jgi:predicted DNA-binding protein
MKRERIILRLREEQKERWEFWADKHGLSVSELIRRAVERFIASSG